MMACEFPIPAKFLSLAAFIYIKYHHIICGNLRGLTFVLSFIHLLHPDQPQVLLIDAKMHPI